MGKVYFSIKNRPENKNRLVFILQGNFYKAEGVDAKILSNNLGYKLRLTDKANGIVECGFPVKTALEKVKKVLDEKRISYVFYRGNIIESEVFYEDSIYESQSEIARDLIPEEKQIVKKSQPEINDNESAPLTTDTVSKEYDGKISNKEFRVLHDAQKFVSEIFLCTSKASREQRFTSCKTIQTLACDLLFGIEETNSCDVGTKKRMKGHKRNLKTIDKILCFLPVIRRLKCISIRQQADLEMELSKIRISYESWVKSDLKRSL